MIDWSRFVTGLFSNPRGVGAVAPSGRALGRVMAAQVSPGARVLELGSGTGSLTRALLARGIAADRLVAVEADPRFAGLLQARFPGVHVVQGDAFDPALFDGDRPFDAVVSGLPLLNFPRADVEALVVNALARMPVGGLVVQFTYGPTSPVPQIEGIVAERVATVVLNLPPANVWTYRRR